MKKSTIDLIAVILILAGLACLFYFPQMYYEKVYNMICDSAQRAEEVLRRGDYETAIVILSDLNDYYNEAEQPLKLYLHHTAVYDVEVAILGCLNLAQARDDRQIFFELQTIQVKAEALRQVELFSLFNLL